MKRSTIKTIIICLMAFLSLQLTALSQSATDSSKVLEAGIVQFDVQDATQEYLNQLTPAQKERSDRYFEGGYWIMLLELALEFIIAWIFLSLGLSQWIYKKTAPLKSQFLKNFLYIILYILLVFLISFPINAYIDFFREHQFGLSNMNFTEWFSESLISLALDMFFMGILFVVLYWVIRKARQWWIICSGIAFLFMTVLFFIEPVFLAPIFNQYKPLEAGALRDDILSLAKANGVPADEVYQFNASKQSTRISANVSGLGSTIRISLNDNLLNRCSTEEIRAVMAHELGHYVLNHVVKMLISFGILVFAGFAFVKWMMDLILKRFGKKWGIPGISDIRSLPLFILAFSLYIFFATPLMNNIIRINEVEADIFGLNAAREPDGFAKVSLKLSDYRKIDPGTLEEILLFDHPSGKTRIYNAMRWKAENLEKE